MCRSIQPLHNYEPPTAADEVNAAALQYVRKISGMTRPARVNQAAGDGLKLERPERPQVAGPPALREVAADTPVTS
jgi:hypothetical protein